MKLIDLTIASRATLYIDLLRMYNLFEKKMNNINGLLVEKDRIDKNYHNFIYGTALSSIFSAIEVLLNDATSRMIVSYPAKIREEDSNKFADFAKSYTFSLMVKKYAEAKLNQLAYKSIRDYLNDIYTFWGEDINNGSNYFNMDTLVEAKASRNLFVHNDSKINDLYFIATGKLSRYPEDYNGNIVIDDDYLTKTKDTITNLANNFKINCIDKHIKDNKINTLKKMWEMSALGKICNGNAAKFEDQWIITGNGDSDDDLRWNNDFSWSYSGSEEAMVKFFKYIFSGNGSEFSNGTNCIPYAIERWKGTINERIILSWLETPFYF